MTPRSRGLGERLARLLLRTLFDEGEVEEIVRDVTELTAGRPGIARHVAFWTSIVGYPLMEARERARAWRGNREGGRTMRTLLEDVRFALRGLRRRPGFAVMASTILGVGFASVVAVQSVVQGVLLDPLGLPDSDRLTTLWLVDRERTRARMTPGNVVDAAGLTEVFTHVAAFQASWGALTDPATGESMMLRGAAVTPAYFVALGVIPLRGRTFVERDADVDEEAVVVLSEHAWRDVYGEDPGILGGYIELHGDRMRVVGIVPDGPYPTSATVDARLPFTDGGRDYFDVIRFAGDYWDLRGPHLLGAVARLRDGTDPETAAAALGVLSARLTASGVPNAGETIVTSPLHEELVGDVRIGLATLFVVVFLVFTISAVNVGSIFLLRAEERVAEVELLGAIGAPPGRLLRQRVAEALLVTTGAAVLGAWTSGWMIEAMRRLLPYQIPRLSGVAVAPGAVVASLLLALAIGAVLGVVPVRLDRRIGGGRTRARVTGGRRQGRMQSVLIAGQAGLAVVVLVGALLLSRSYAALRSNDPGFDANETWVLELVGGGYEASEAATILDRVRALPGIASAAFSFDHPLERRWEDGFRLTAGAGAGRDTVEQASIRPYGDGYFGTVGVPLLDGRLPDLVDRSGEPRLAVVNDAFRRAYMAGEFLPARDRVVIPSGDRRLGEGGSVFDVVGVVADVRFLGPEAPSEPAIYVPFEHFAVRGSVLLVRPQVAGDDLPPSLRAAIAESVPGVVIDVQGTLARLHGEALARPRFNMMLLAAMSAAALLLCTLGAYGIVSRTVATRRREIGVRAALGAARVDITRGVMGRALRPLALGTAAGVAVSLGASRLLASLLYELSPTDPVSLVGAPLILLIIGCVAALVPSRRALAVDPAESLRPE